MRGLWEYASTDVWDDASIAITAGPKGLLVEVTEEQAVDSHNEHFTCSVTIPWEAVPGLKSFLGSVGIDTKIAAGA
jgi:hypothetical protein